MAWRLAKSLETLRNQVNAAYPNRSRVSDGTILPKIVARWYDGDMNKEVWEKVKKVGWTQNGTGCYEYNGYKNEHGYGQFRPGKSGKLVRVHRLAYHLLVEPITSKDVIMHQCDNPPCLNVKHLKKGTQRENIKQMWAKGRGDRSGWTHCPSGHKYPDNRPVGMHSNRCRPCANERSRKYYAKKKGLSYELASS